MSCLTLSPFIPSHSLTPTLSHSHSPLPSITPYHPSPFFLSVPPFNSTCWRRAGLCCKLHKKGNNLVSLPPWITNQTTVPFTQPTQPRGLLIDIGVHQIKSLSVNHSMTHFLFNANYLIVTTIHPCNRAFSEVLFRLSLAIIQFLFSLIHSCGMTSFY